MSENQELEQILRTAGILREGKLSEVQEKNRRIIESNEGKDYGLVSTDSVELMLSQEGYHYHFGSRLYLVFKPMRIIRDISYAKYLDNRPGQNTYSELELDEQKEFVTVKYHFRFPLSEGLDEGTITKRFQWVSTTTKKQGGEEKTAHSLVKIE